jgi:hypothetical protein
MIYPLAYLKALGCKLLMSSALLCALGPLPLAAHEVLPAIMDVRQVEDRLDFVVSLNLEAILAGIDLSSLTDTNLSPKAQDYDLLRSKAPQALALDLADYWPSMVKNIQVFDQDRSLDVQFDQIEVPPIGALAQVRSSVLSFHVELPRGTQQVAMGWSADYGALVLRQMGVENPYTGYLEGGEISDAIVLQGGGQMGPVTAFWAYVPVGFDHILPKGLDHILFVLGLFFLSPAWRPLILQISTFTLAHTLTLGLAALGYVRLPSELVESMIAASIVFVAVENTFAKGLSRSRPFVVFGFGLLHGLGFASVLVEFGLPQHAFIPALIGFNVGVELGQLIIVAFGFGLLSYWFGKKSWYRLHIALPASGAIALVGAWWVVERTLL